MSAIALLFAKYVKNGTYKIEQVPELWREEVRDYLDEENDDEKESSESL